MTTYKFKYALGDRVWTMVSNKPVNVEVHEHKVKAAKSNYRNGNLTYGVSAESYCSDPIVKHEGELFKSRALLLKSL